MKMVNLTGDGCQVEVPLSQQCWRLPENRIEIPAFVMKGSQPATACRMCVVEVEGNKKNLPNTCAQPVME